MEKADSEFLSDPFDSPDGEVVRFTMFKELEMLAPDPPLPFGYRLEPWTDLLMPAYAAVLAVSFSDSPDLDHYPRLASRDGCLSMLKEIAGAQGFITGGSWLVLANKEPAATILTSRTRDGVSGFINVVAVAPRHRLMGIGRHLVSKALWTFRDRHLDQGILRVNRSNRGALRFFRSAGFQAGESRTYL
jgi:ribosomal protein S18 acetylase RimI-like enzyme